MAHVHSHIGGNGIAYFGAGIFPHQNVYVCAVNAADGSVVWRAQVYEPLDTAGGLSVGDLDSDGHGEVYVTSFVEGF